MGHHVVTFYFEAIGLGEGEMTSPMVFDVAANTRAIGITQIDGANGTTVLKGGTLDLPFNNISADSVIEFRIYAFGRPYEGKFTFRGVLVRRQPNLEPFLNQSTDFSKME